MTESPAALARLCFYLPADRVSQFESTFESKLLPRLKDYGLVPAADLGRETIDEVFHRLFSLESATEVTAVQRQLSRDADWEHALDEIGGDLGATISFRFEAYRVTGPVGRHVEVDESREAEGNWTTFTTANLVSGDLVTCILRDREGRFWFSTAHAGMTRFDGREWVDFGPGETGVDISRCWTMLEDTAGRIWFGSHSGGVTCYDGETWTSYTSADGLSHDSVIAGYQDRDGDFWFGTDSHDDPTRGMARFDGESWTCYTVVDGLPSNRVKWISQDRRNRYWFGTASGVAILDGGEWETHGIAEGLPGEWIESILHDREGDVWVTTDRGLGHFDGMNWTGYTAQDGLPGSWITASFQDSRDILWFGTLNAGVCCYDGETFQTLNHEDGLSGDAVWWIHEDEKGDYWFATDGGVSRYRPPESDPPSIELTAVTADRHYDSFEDLIVPAPADLLAFEFDGQSSHTRHGGLVYRHRLVGSEDENWHRSLRRRAEYSYLEPGTYTFQVQAVDQLLDYSPIIEVQVTVQDTQSDRIGELEGEVAELSKRLDRANENLRDAGLPEA